MTQIWEEIEGSYGRDPLFEPLKRMFAFFTEANEGELRLVTINQISEISGIGRDDGQLIRLISILASPSLRLIKMCFIYSNGDTEYEITDEDVAEARATGIFYDQVTGLKDENYERNILPFFRATSEFLEVRS
ncbi:MAG TPA: hypothetical protein VGC14_16725 [Rhizobium sp.]